MGIGRRAIVLNWRSILPPWIFGTTFRWPNCALTSSGSYPSTAQQYPQQAEQSAFEPFYFCEAIGVEVPLGMEAWTLEEFRDGLEKLSHAAFHFHFIASRLRLHLRTNDFSYWLESGLDLGTLARQVNRIDIYTNTLGSALQRIISLVEKELHS